MPVARPHQRWPLASRIIVGVCKNCCRITYRRLVGRPPTLWASFACAQTPHKAVVWGPRLAVELPIQELFILDNNKYSLDIAQSLVTCLPSSLKRELISSKIASAQAIESEKHRMGALVELLPHLKDYLEEDVLQDAYTTVTTCAIASAQAIESETDWVKVLVELLPHLKDHLKEDILRDAYTTVANMKSEKEIWQAMLALSPFLPNSLLRQALCEELPMTEISSLSILLGSPA